MSRANPYEVVKDESAIASVLRSMIIVDRTMMDEANGIIKSTLNPLNKAYWRGRRDVYESHMRSCEVLLGIDGLLESGR